MLRHLLLINIELSLSEWYDYFSNKFWILKGKQVMLVTDFY